MLAYSGARSTASQRLCETLNIHRFLLVAAAGPVIPWIADNEPRPKKAVNPDFTHKTQGSGKS